MTETEWPTKHKIFTIWCFIENVDGLGHRWSQPSGQVAEITCVGPLGGDGARGGERSMVAVVGLPLATMFWPEL